VSHAGDVTRELLKIHEAGETGTERER